jgi:hypothetical protein
VKKSMPKGGQHCHMAYLSSDKLTVYEVLNEKNHTSKYFDNDFTVSRL